MTTVETTSVSLHQILRLRRKYCAAFQDMIGQKMDVQTMGTMSRRLAKLTKVPKSAEPADTCGESSHDGDAVVEGMISAIYRLMSEEAAGQVLTDELADYLSLRFAGNFIKYRSSWQDQKHSSWVIAEVVNTVYHVTPVRHIRGAELTFLLWSGAQAGKRISQFFTKNALSRMATKLGLMARFKRRTVHYREFARLKLLLNLQSTDRLALQYKEQGALNNRNKHRIACRKDKTGCRHKIKLPCHFCHVSYKACVNSTHPQEFVQRMCKSGHEGWFVNSKGDLCLSCQASRWLESNL